MTTSEVVSVASQDGWASSTSPPSESDAAHMSELGIRFDGRFYRYKEYRYDLLTDALNYAAIDWPRSNEHSIANCTPVWTAPEQPTKSQQAMMTECGVTFDGKYYRYRDYRYDALTDALNYAREKKSS